MTVFLLGYAISQVVWGLLADHYGRRPIVLSATFIAIFGSVLTGLSVSLPWFFAGRFIEAIGAGFSTVLARALLVDSYQGKALKANMSYIIILAALMPAVALILGGHILQWSNWHIIYFFLAIIGVILLIAELFTLQETIARPDSHISLVYVGKAMRSLFSNYGFLSFALPFGCVMGGLISFYAIAPFIYITQLQLDPNNYGYLLLFVGAGYVVGAFLFRFFLHLYPARKVVLLGFAINAVTVVFASIAWLLNDMSVITVTISACFFSLSCGLISPTSNVSALSVLKSYHGLASAILPSLAMIFSSLATGLLAGVHYTSMLPLVCFWASTFGLALLTFFLFGLFSSTVN